ncbi:hypothetical protein BLX88_05830 [Bacillus obstructivus]|uniref:YybS family protein n=1 Tax=Heyndrickxia oleronia TaxID=38875 RepID=UPI0007171C02|nr:hypothetical protein BLX88_05830 [Bacillus obstructivus]
MGKSKMLTEGALMLAVFAILLFIYNYIPLLSIVSVLFLLLPFILYSAKYPFKHALVLLIGSILISVLLGSLFLIPVALIYGTTGIAIGYCIRTKKSKFVLYMSASILFLLNAILQYIAFIVLFNKNILKVLITTFQDSFQQSAKILEGLGQGSSEQLMEQYNAFLDTITTLLPSLLVISSFVVVWILLAINLPIVKRFKIDVPKWNAFRELKLPKSILWYYLITIILAIIWRPEQGTYGNMALVNLNFILQMLMVLQGYSFVFFFSHEKRWTKAIPILIVIFTFFLFPLQYIIRILGIMDLGFGLRQFLNRKSS